MTIGNHSVEVLAERERQVAKWGLQIHPNISSLKDTEHEDGVTQRILSLYEAQADDFKDMNDDISENGTMGWDTILLEETYEALAETDPVKLRTELVQTAAVIFAWMDDLDRRENERMVEIDT